MVLVFFSHRNQEWDRVVTIYKIPVNFWLLRKFRSFRFSKRENGNTSESQIITFFPQHSTRNEPFHLNSPRNYRILRANGKRSKLQ